MAIAHVGTGAGASGDNVDLTPALPTGGAAPIADDLILCLAGIRSSTATMAVSGYTAIFEIAPSASARIGLFRKWAVGGDSAPIVDYSGGIAGNTTVAQCAVLRGVDLTTPVDILGADSNGTSVNIGPITGLTPGVDNAAVLVPAFKADDWTAGDVPVLTGDGLTWIELGDPSSTAGADAGLVWDLAIITGAPVTITSKTFAPTAGASNQWAGKMVSFAPAAAIIGKPAHKRILSVNQAVHRASRW